MNFWHLRAAARGAGERGAGEPAAGAKGCWESAGAPRPARPPASRTTDGDTRPHIFFTTRPPLSPAVCCVNVWASSSTGRSAATCFSRSTYACERAAVEDKVQEWR